MSRSLSRWMMRARRALPAPVRRAVDAAVAAERGPFAWIMDRTVPGADAVPPLSADPTRRARLLIAPMNYAGQGSAWAASAQSEDVEAQNLAVEFPGSFRFPATRHVPARTFLGSPSWRRSQREALASFTHVMIESFTSVLGRGSGRAITAEVAEMTRAGIRVALVCHGTDVRLPSAHRRRNRHSPFEEMSTREREDLERLVAENLEVARSFAGPVYVSTPDLLLDVPGADWLPVVIDPERWHSARGVDAAVPVVLHVPSAGPVKGTRHVEAAARELQAGGVIEYRTLQGIPSAEMPGRIADADIVVDQLLIGSYGVAACEAMAAGRVVVGNVDEQVRAHVRSVTGLELPIVQADPDTLRGVLERLAESPDERREAGAAGRSFVRLVHDGSFTRPALTAFLDPVVD